jgi:hypothetical protein
MLATPWNLAKSTRVAARAEQVRQHFNYQRGRKYLRASATGEWR